MAILKDHIPYYREIFKIPNTLSEPFLMFGYQDFLEKDLPKDFAFKDVREMLISKGISKITTLDLFDRRADLKYDMNLPVPQYEIEKYSTFLDIGCLEHIFDSKQCIENCMRMIKVGGIYILHTAVNGYFGHGLHVFNPEGILEVLKLNNFEILYLRYTTPDGRLLNNANDDESVLMWVVSKKLKSIDKFIIPQQKMWQPDVVQSNIEGISKSVLKYTIYKILLLLWKFIYFLKYHIKRFLTA